MDSNHRRQEPADLQSAPFGHSGNHPKVASPHVFRKASAKIVFSNDNQFKTPNNFKVFNTSSVPFHPNGAHGPTRGAHGPIKRCKIWL